MELAAVTSWATGSFAVIGRCCAQRLGLTVILSIRCFGGAARRAESNETRRLPANRLAPGLVGEESDPMNGYASAVGLCQDSTIMQSRKQSNVAFWSLFSM